MTKIRNVLDPEVAHESECGSCHFHTQIAEGKQPASSINRHACPCSIATSRAITPFKHSIPTSDMIMSASGIPPTSADITPPSVLDHRIYPHIVRRILTFLPPPALATFMRTSKKTSEEAAMILYRHAALYLDDTHAHDIRPSPLHPNGLTKDHYGRGDHRKPKASSFSPCSSLTRSIMTTGHAEHDCKSESLPRTLLPNIKVWQYYPKMEERRCGMSPLICAEVTTCGFMAKFKPEWIILRRYQNDFGRHPISYLERDQMARFPSHVRRFTLTLPAYSERYVYPSGYPNGSSEDPVYEPEVFNPKLPVSLETFEIICTPYDDGTYQFVKYFYHSVEVNGLPQMRDMIVNRLVDTTCSFNLIGFEYFKYEWFGQKTAVAEREGWTFEAELHGALQAAYGAGPKGGGSGTSKIETMKKRLVFKTLSEYLDGRDVKEVFDADDVETFRQRIRGEVQHGPELPYIIY